MTREQLLEKFQNARGAAQIALDNANKALEAGNDEDYNKYSSEHDAHIKSAKQYQTQIAKLDDLSTVDAPEAPKTEKAVRLPFATDADVDTDVPDQAKDTDEPEPNAIYVKRFGETDAAIKAVARDLYGNGWLQQRADQMNAFVKMLRTGRINLEEERLLKTLIMRPEAIEREIAEFSDIKTVKATLQEGVADLGGHLVPEDFRIELVKRMAGPAVVRRFARVVETNRAVVEWPKLEGGDDRYTSAVRVTWIDEVPGDANVAETSPTFGMWRVPVNTAMARTDISRNQLEDSPFNMLGVIADLFAEAMVIDEDDKYITGLGTGVPKGILGERANGAQAAPVQGVEAVTTKSAGSLTPDGLIDLVYELPAQYRRNAVMLAARKTYREIRQLKDSENQYLWEPNYKVGQPATVLGYQAFESESVPAVAANNHAVLFGDLKGYLIVDRIGMGFERVEDTTTVGRNKVAVFLRRRVGGQVIEPWRILAHKVSA